MRSLQWKVTFALLFTSLLSVALVGIIARHMLSSKFDQIAMKKSLDELRGELQLYLGTYGTWEKGAQSEPFERWVRRRREASVSNQHGSAPAAPRFHFMVISPTGMVLLGPQELQGRPAPAKLQAEAEPVEVNGQIAVKVVPSGQPNYTDQDREFLSAMQQALVRGIFVATLLALALGIFFGQSLSSALRHLTAAIEAMSYGALRQQVEIDSDDEVGVLADAFNRMSSELSQAHEELQESHAKISQQAALLQELAVRDGLTKLHNRRFFDERGANLFAQSKRYNRPLTVMIGDIDFFKKINDNFSHATGDEVLRHVAAILRKNTRETDIVARYGGEEFVIAFPETELLAALALCERLRQIIEAYPWHQIHENLRVTMSMGLNQDMTLESFERMIAAADERLYEAKESGRNRVCAPTVQ